MVKIVIIDRRLKCHCGGDQFSLEVPTGTLVEDVISGNIDFMSIEMRCLQCSKRYIGMNEVTNGEKNGGSE